MSCNCVNADRFESGEQHSLRSAPYFRNSSVTRNSTHNITESSTLPLPQFRRFEAYFHFGHQGSATISKNVAHLEQKYLRQGEDLIAKTDSSFSASWPKWSSSYRAIPVSFSIKFMPYALTKLLGWRDFMDQDLLWSIDPKGPVSRRPRRWRAPFWSWASTEDGRVVNMYYKRLPVEPRLMLKPELFVGVNTSFDQSLPIPAWTHENYRMELKGDLRNAELTTELDDAGPPVYKISLESTGRFSNEEEHEFRPDAPLEVGSIAVQCLLFLHYDKEALGGDYYIDVRLVLLVIGNEGDENYDRVMKRIGYLESTYKEM